VNSINNELGCAVDAEAGKIKWYFQVVQHDLCDFDLAASTDDGRARSRLVG